jgi:cytochrome P450
LLAGTDTTAGFMTFILFEIFSHPEVEKRVRAEIDAAIRSDSDITP